MTGHPPSDDPCFGKAMRVMFPGNKDSISCYVDNLSRVGKTTLSREETTRERLRRKLELKRQGRTST